MKQFDYLLIMLNYYYCEIVNKPQDCNWKMTQFRELNNKKQNSIGKIHYEQFSFSECMPEE